MAVLVGKSLVSSLVSEEDPSDELDELSSKASMTNCNQYAFSGSCVARCRSVAVMMRVGRY